MEIELKLACQTGAIDSFINKVIPVLEHRGIEVTQSTVRLFNEYYDTDDAFFEQHKMGLRVRAADGKYEQTIKTRGKAVGGLHQRPEYNVDLKDASVDLSLFDTDIWPDGTNVDELQSRLAALFATDFVRNTFVLSTQEYSVEVVFDVGEVSREQHSIDICEIELELISGDTLRLFDVAELIVKHIPCRLSNITKAARGYQLIHGRRDDVVKLPQYVMLEHDVTTEEAFCATINLALSHWQHHQHMYAQTKRLKALHHIREALMLLLQAVSLYLPVLQCAELLSLHKQLLQLTRSWAWQTQLTSVYKLRSRSGPFSRRIPKNPNIMNYLMGRREGLLNAQQPAKLNMSTLSTQVQLATSRILIEKPWQEGREASSIKLRKHAQGWLSQTWQTILHSLPDNEPMDEKQYLAIEVMLQQSLLNGFMVASLFSEQREMFRAPWLDILSGIQELKALKFLHSSLDDIDAENKQDLLEWIQDKTHAVMTIMEQTRLSAQEQEPYW